MQDTEFTIKVINFEKYNPKPKHGEMKWFRLNADFIFDSKIYSLPISHKVIFVLLCSLCAKSGQGECKVSAKWGQAWCKMKRYRFVQALETLEKVGLIKISSIKELQTVQTTQRKTPKPKKSPLKKLPEASPPDASHRVELPPLASIWNKIVERPFSQVRDCSSQRRRLAAARWKANPDTKYWVKTVKRITESRFCSGEGDKGWIANFDWLLKPETHIRVNEGLYDNKPDEAKSTYREFKPQ